MVVLSRTGQDSQIEFVPQQPICQAFGETFAQFQPNAWKTPREAGSQGTIKNIRKTGRKRNANCPGGFSIFCSRLRFYVIERAQQPPSSREQNLAGFRY